MPGKRRRLVRVTRPTARRRAPGNVPRQPRYSACSRFEGTPTRRDQIRLQMMVRQESEQEAWNEQNSTRGGRHLVDADAARERRVRRIERAMGTRGRRD